VGVLIPRQHQHRIHHHQLVCLHIKTRPSRCIRCFCQYGRHPHVERAGRMKVDLNRESGRVSRPVPAEADCGRQAESVPGRGQGAISGSTGIARGGRRSQSCAKPSILPVLLPHYRVGHRRQLEDKLSLNVEKLSLGSVEISCQGQRREADEGSGSTLTRAAEGPVPNERGNLDLAHL
jgi:hypothetical protein